MKTIEERAYKFAKEYLPTPDGVYARSDVEVMMKNCAIQIAIEQRRIDTEKALSFLRYHGEGDFSCWEEFEANFRKTMEL